MHKKIEQEGETILVSEGLEDMDPESLVESDLEALLSASGKEGSKQNFLAPKITLEVYYFVRDLRACEKPLIYTGTLKSQTINLNPQPLDFDTSSKTLCLYMSLQDALELFRFFEVPKYQLRGSWSVDYVWKRENQDLKKHSVDLNHRQFIKKMEISEIKNSTCLCSLVFSF